MENLLFIKIEIFIFLFSFLYILYYFCEKFFAIYFKVKNVVNPEKVYNTKSGLNTVNINNVNREFSAKDNIVKISLADKQKVLDIIKRVKVNSSKGYYDTSKNLIVEGLSYDKYNKDLNIELATIYEKEKNYLNAEYVYKDLLDVLKYDFEVMKKLGYIYAMQNKLQESLEIYEKMHAKKNADDEVIDILSEITFNLKDYKKSLKYTNLFLVSKPRNVDKLFIKAKCLEELGNDKDALLIYKRILELQPYNTKAKDNVNIIEKSLTSV